jgi:hypothetical protein
LHPYSLSQHDRLSFFSAHARVVVGGAGGAQLPAAATTCSSNDAKDATVPSEACTAHLADPPACSDVTVASSPAATATTAQDVNCPAAVVSSGTTVPTLAPSPTALFPAFDAANPATQRAVVPIASSVPTMQLTEASTHLVVEATSQLDVEGGQGQPQCDIAVIAVGVAAQGCAVPDGTGLPVVDVASHGCSDSPTDERLHQNGGPVALHSGSSCNAAHSSSIRAVLERARGTLKGGAQKVTRTAAKLGDAVTGLLGGCKAAAAADAVTSTERCIVEQDGERALGDGDVACAGGFTRLWLHASLAASDDVLQVGHILTMAACLLSGMAS